jgi:hypothetical protein
MASIALSVIGCIDYLAYGTIFTRAMFLPKKKLDVFFPARKAVDACREVVCPLQLGLHKRRLSYDFSFYVGCTGHIPKNFRSAALSTATQPW